MKTLVRIVAALPLEAQSVRLEFTDGTTRVVNLRPLMKGPVFVPLLADAELFREVKVDEELGTIVWPNGADLCPDMLYEGLTPAK